MWEVVLVLGGADGHGARARPQLGHRVPPPKLQGRQPMLHPPDGFKDKWLKWFQGQMAEVVQGQMAEVVSLKWFHGQMAESGKVPAEKYSACMALYRYGECPVTVRVHWCTTSVANSQVVRA